MLSKYAIILLVAQLSALFCYGQQLQIDHVIFVTRDIDSTTNQLKKQGFKVKEGRLHRNGITNAFIKFPNASELELISINGLPKDKLAKEYSSLLSDKEGGVFIAISGISTEEFEKLIRKTDISYKKQINKFWNYISFPEEKSLSHFFFLEYKIPNKHPSSLFQHKNNVIAIEEVIIEGNKRTVSFLQKIQIKENSSNSEKATFETPTGKITIHLTDIKPKKRLRIKSVILRRKQGKLNFTM